MVRTPAAIALIVFALLAVAACAAPSGALHSAIWTSYNGVRTFTLVQDPLPSESADPDPCGPMLPPVTHVKGRLEGDPDIRIDPAWIQTDDNEVLHVVWPYGYTVTFDALRRPTLWDETGRVRARAGDTIELNVSVTSHEGTVTDPYIATWFLPDLTCYSYTP